MVLVQFSSFVKVLDDIQERITDKYWDTKTYGQDQLTKYSFNVDLRILLASPCRPKCVTYSSQKFCTESIMIRKITTVRL
jgi:hypothetical protein